MKLIKVIYLPSNIANVIVDGYWDNNPQWNDISWVDVLISGIWFSGMIIFILSCIANVIVLMNWN